jgi:hypothetical protein
MFWGDCLVAVERINDRPVGAICVWARKSRVNKGGKALLVIFLIMRVYWNCFSGALKLFKK